MNGKIDVAALRAWATDHHAFKRAQDIRALLDEREELLAEIERLRGRVLDVVKSYRIKAPVGPFEKGYNRAVQDIAQPKSFAARLAALEPSDD